MIPYHVFSSFIKTSSIIIFFVFLSLIETSSPIFFYVSSLFKLHWNSIFNHLLCVLEPQWNPIFNFLLCVLNTLQALLKPHLQSSFMCFLASMKPPPQPSIVYLWGCKPRRRTWLNLIGLLSVRRASLRKTSSSSSSSSPSSSCPLHLSVLGNDQVSLFSFEMRSRDIKVSKKKKKTSCRETELIDICLCGHEHHLYET